MNMNVNRDNDNNNDNDRMNEKELIYLAVFEQIKECRDIISSLLIIYEFIKSENISTTFNVSELRQFALSAAHNKTSTHLWHINALIATSQNFNDLLIGIEMCFDGWLGNKQSFIKHKNKQKSSSKLSSKSPSKSKQIKQAPKAEITSFVTSYYQPSIDIDIEQDENKSDIDDDEANQLQDIVRINDENENINLKNEGMEAENENIMIDDENSKEFEKEEFMKSYRGKISSPISFRMRQQKRMKQRERRQNSSRNRNINNNRFLNINNHENNDDTFQKKLDFQSFDNMNNNKNESNMLSPFNISKFAKRVDLVPNDMDSPQFHRKNI